MRTGEKGLLSISLKVLLIKPKQIIPTDIELAKNYCQLLAYLNIIVKISN